jgi:hypothetical protein
MVNPITNNNRRKYIPGVMSLAGMLPPDAKAQLNAFIANYKNRGGVTPPPAMKKGGKIKKTGVYLLHKNEVVVPANRVKSVDKSLKKDNKKPLKK